MGQILGHSQTTCQCSSELGLDLLWCGDTCRTDSTGSRVEPVIGGTGPRLSGGLRLVSYEAIPWQASSTPHAAEIRFRTRRRLQPARFRVACEGTIHSATAVLEIMKSGKAIDGFSYYESTRVVQADVVVVEVSDRPIAPEDQFYIQVRSSTPVHIREVKKLRAKGARGEGFSPNDLSI